MKLPGCLFQWMDRFQRAWHQNSQLKKRAFLQLWLLCLRLARFCRKVASASTAAFSSMVRLFPGGLAWDARAQKANRRSRSPSVSLRSPQRPVITSFGLNNSSSSLETSSFWPIESWRSPTKAWSVRGPTWARSTSPPMCSSRSTRWRGRREARSWTRGARFEAAPSGSRGCQAQERRPLPSPSKSTSFPKVILSGILTQSSCLLGLKLCLKIIRDWKDFSVTPVAFLCLSDYNRTSTLLKPIVILKKTQSQILKTFLGYNFGLCTPPRLLLICSFKVGTNPGTLMNVHILGQWFWLVLYVISRQ